MSILIRRARHADAVFLVDSQVRMAKETEDLDLDPPTVTAGVSAVLDDPRLGQYWIAERKSTPMACTLVTGEWSDWRNGIVWWLQSVYVRPEHRRRGVFRAIYTHLRQLVESDDRLRGLRLYVEKGNALAQEVYRSLGMHGDHYATFEWMK
mgnify:FL=1